MTEVASRELRNATRALLDRVTAGETITITVDGRPAAVLGPVERRPRWISRQEFLEKVRRHPADRGLLDELSSMYDDTTDDLPLG